MRRFLTLAVCATVLAGQAAFLAGCAKDDVEEARERMRKEGQSRPDGPAPGAGPQASAPMGGAHPGGPMGGGHPGGSMPGAHPGGMPMMGSSGPSDGNEIPLKLTGLGSAAELARELAKLTDKQAAAHFERAFRLTFCSDMTKRDYGAAEELLQPLSTSHPKFAPIYRTLGYARFNQNPMQPDESLRDYEKAVQLDPSYGEAYYAIAFMCAATGDRDKGVEAYRKAMKLGVPDERNIGPSFYADLLESR